MHRCKLLLLNVVGISSWCFHGNDEWLAILLRLSTDMTPQSQHHDPPSRITKVIASLILPVCVLCLVVHVSCSVHNCPHILIALLLLYIMNHSLLGKLITIKFFVSGRFSLILHVLLKCLMLCVLACRYSHSFTVFWYERCTAGTDGCTQKITRHSVHTQLIFHQCISGYCQHCDMLILNKLCMHTYTPRV